MRDLSCIPSIVKGGAYPALSTREPNARGFLTAIPPPAKWETQLTREQSATLGRITSIVIRSNDEIWISSTGGNGVRRYKPTTHELFTYTVKVNDSEFAPSKIFLTKDGTLWGLGNSGVNGKLDAYFSGAFRGFLSRYDAKADRFEPIMDTDNILTGLSVADVEEDTKGNLWLAFENGLVRYNPHTNNVNQMLNKEQGYLFHNFAIAPNGTIWLGARQAPSELERLMHYDPNTGEIKSFGKYGIPPEVNNRLEFLTLYFDRAGRLWVNDYGWLENPSEYAEYGQATWYEIIQSPVFITDRYGGDVKYGWFRTDSIYEDTQGTFWFSSIAGLASFVPSSGEWCLVSTASGLIAEDNKHNLWFAGDGQIYKYQLPSLKATPIPIQ